MTDKKLIFQFRGQKFELYPPVYIISSKEQRQAIIEGNALNFFTTACKEEPNNFILWLNKSCALRIGKTYAPQDFKKARQALKKALKLDSDGIIDILEKSLAINHKYNELRSWILNETGILLEAQGKYEQALAVYNNALTLEIPANCHAMILINKGVALFRQGKDEQALAHYKKALAQKNILIELEATIFNNIGMVFKWQRKDDKKSRAFKFRDALHALSKQQSIGPNETHDIRLCLIEQYNNRKNPDLKQAKRDLIDRRASRKAARQAFIVFQIDEQVLIPEDVEKLILDYVDKKRYRTLDQDPLPGLFENTKGKMRSGFHFVSTLFQRMSNQKDHNDAKDYPDQLDTEVTDSHHLDLKT